MFQTEESSARYAISHRKSYREEGDQVYFWLIVLITIIVIALIILQTTFTVKIAKEEEELSTISKSTRREERKIASFLRRRKIGLAWITGLIAVLVFLVTLFSGQTSSSNTISTERRVNRE